MSHQGGQAIERGPVRGASRPPREASAFGVEPRPSDLANQVSVGGPSLHGLIVGVRPVSKELQTPSEPLSSALQTLENWHQEARRAAGLDEGQLCAYIGNGKGGAYDQSQWNAARKSGNLPLGRIIANAPDLYLRTFAACFATFCGLRVSHADLADIAFERTAVAFEAVADAFRHMQRRSIP